MSRRQWQFASPFSIPGSMHTCNPTVEAHHPAPAPAEQESALSVMQAAWKCCKECLLSGTSLVVQRVGLRVSTARV